MCPPVAVPAQPRILAGRRFLRISPDFSPKRGGAELIPYCKIDHWSILQGGMSTIRHSMGSKNRIGFYLHKEFRAAGIRFLPTQRIPRG